MTRRARHRSEAGQTTALVCAMLFTLAMFVALVVNVGQLVNRRVSLQLLADAGAWSGATVQAVQLNHYAYWSRLIQNTYKNASGVSLGFTFGECESSYASVLAFEVANAGMIAAQASFFNKAYREAESHTLFNIDDLFPGERQNFDYSTIAGPEAGMVGAPGNGNIVAIPLRQGERLYTGDHAWRRETAVQIGVEAVLPFTGRLPGARSTAGGYYEQWQCAQYIPPFQVIILPVYMAGFAGYKLLRPDLVPPYLFVWKVSERRGTRAFFFDRFFGPDAVPPMTAVAAAKAVGGHVYEGRSRYRAKMIPVRQYSLTQGAIQDPQARPGRILPNPLRLIVH